MRAQLALTAAALCLAAVAGAGSDPVAAGREAHAGGGGDAGAGAFALRGTIGQADAHVALTGGAFAMSGGFWSGGSGAVVGVDDDVAPAPARLTLSPAHPNPFNPRTTLTLGLPHAGAIDVRIFDVGGRLVRVLAAGAFPPGEHALVWDGTDTRGTPVASGRYIAVLDTNGEHRVRHLTLLK